MPHVEKDRSFEISGNIIYSRNVNIPSCLEYEEEALLRIWEKSSTATIKADKTEQLIVLNKANYLAKWVSAICIPNDVITEDLTKRQNYSSSKSLNCPWTH